MNLFALGEGIEYNFNLDRFSPTPVLDPWSYFLVGLIVPWALIWGLCWWSGRRQGRRKLPVDDIKAAEVLAEAEEVQG